jgi:hypothetical protein
MTGGTPTFFDVFDFNTGGQTSAVPFTSTPGTITITQASVPEPASIFSGLIGVAFVAGLHATRRFRRSRSRVA